MTSPLLHNSDEWNTLLDELAPSSIIVLTDHNTENHCLPYFLSTYLEGEKFTHLSVLPGEESKSMACAEELWSVLLEEEVDRKALFISLGGGVITDLGGFVASTFKRGMPFIHVPTTHLGMTDAAIGGKNGVNFQGLKNQLGTIRQPKAILIDAKFLDTLPELERRAGFMETLKHALIADAAFWKNLKNRDDSTRAVSNEIIHHSASIKQRIIAQDQDDFGIRQSLNFGHTVGHAVEALTGISHGEAVAFGIVAESFISNRQCGLSDDELDDICHAVFGCLSPTLSNDLDTEALIQLMKSDKKNEYGEVRFSLIFNIGTSTIGETVPIEVVAQSIAFALSKMKR